MAKTGISIEGLDRVNMKLAFIKNPEMMVGAVKAAATEVKGLAAQYPPKPAHSTYERTGNLGKRWRVNPTKWGASVTNNTYYGPYVQGEKQTWFHAAAGWKTTEQIAELSRERVIEIIHEQIRKVLEK